MWEKHGVYNALANSVHYFTQDGITWDQIFFIGSNNSNLEISTSRQIPGLWGNYIYMRLENNSSSKCYGASRTNIISKECFFGGDSDESNKWTLIDRIEPFAISADEEELSFICLKGGNNQGWLTKEGEVLGFHSADTAACSFRYEDEKLYGIVGSNTASSNIFTIKNHPWVYRFYSNASPKVYPSIRGC